MHQHTQTAAFGQQAAATSSPASFKSVTDVYDECMASISASGTAFQEALHSRSLPADVDTDGLQSWADPDAQM